MVIGSEASLLALVGLTLLPCAGPEHLPRMTVGSGVLGYG